jgi:hypothetical protein
LISTSIEDVKLGKRSRKLTEVKSTKSETSLKSKRPKISEDHRDEKTHHEPEIMEAVLSLESSQSFNADNSEDNSSREKR